MVWPWPPPCLLPQLSSWSLFLVTSASLTSSQVFTPALPSACMFSPPDLVISRPLISSCLGSQCLIILRTFQLPSWKESPLFLPSSVFSRKQSPRQKHYISVRRSPIPGSRNEEEERTDMAGLGLRGCPHTGPRECYASVPDHPGQEGRLYLLASPGTPAPAGHILPSVMPSPTLLCCVEQLPQAAFGEARAPGG